MMMRHTHERGQMQDPSSADMKDQLNEMDLSRPGPKQLMGDERGKPNSVARVPGCRKYHSVEPQ